MVKIGIIGGSGLDDPDILKNKQEKETSTPFGKPSSFLTIGKIGNVDVVILARHGKKHTITPTEVNYRANIHALKQEGCTHIFATTAVGSLKEEIERGDLVIIDQFIDFTKHREISFYESFEDGPKHTSMAEPFNKFLREKLIETCKELKYKMHEKGTVITIEGPRFSTKAESKLFRMWGADIINMSIAPEVILANEAGIPYAAIAMSTDYDCWREGEESVSWEQILSVFHSNSKKVVDLLIKVIPKIK
ncbi:S-methyl-5'-thioadenosine phosphorylase [Candidatus Woesearchaeota archaeon]|nr:S-methyl-5'-thioadenosine phosphorylase [Candidatus Woesearchaeota archaeon]